MASSISPLLDRASIDLNDKNTCNKCRKLSLFWYPAILVAILVLCIIAYLAPSWWNGNGSSSIIQTSGHSWMNAEEAEIHKLGNRQLNVEYTSEALTDLVSSLPGLDADALDFQHFSGYVDANDGKQIHYWFFEAQSNANTAPLFFWTNGGPGCSGLCGLLTEHGPFWAIEDGTLMVNEYSWNKEINIVYFEQPYGVGFSTVDEGLEAVSGDAEAVSDFDAAVRSFITKFPSFADREIYLSSESFGGHYMPLTAIEIMKNNNAGVTPKINFKGFMVGNPYTNGMENTIGAVEAFYGHGLMRNDIYETWKQYCFGDEVAMENTHCRYLYMIGYYEADNIDHYALDFDYCVNDVSWNKHKKHLLFHSKMVSRVVDRLLTRFKSDKEWDDYTEKTIRPMFKGKNAKRKGKRRLLSRKDVQRMKARLEGMYTAQEQERRRLNIEWENDDVEYYPCAADLMTNYLNTDIVQDALHVKEKTDWEMCNDDIFKNWPDADWDNNMMPYYAQLAAKYPELNIMVFSGDDDSVCGTHGTQYWLDQMGDKYSWSVDSDNEWIPWEYGQQLGGYRTKYLTKNGDTALCFHTVRTAGHMVPQTQPQRAIGLLRYYLNSPGCE